jgi:hypothetical protein
MWHFTFKGGRRCSAALGDGHGHQHSTCMMAVQQCAVHVFPGKAAHLL